MTNVVQLPMTADASLAIANEAADIIGIAIRLRMKIFQHPTSSPLPADIMDDAYDALNALIKAAEQIGDLT